jgi:hypothetical protein
VPEIVGAVLAAGALSPVSGGDSSPASGEDGDGAGGVLVLPGGLAAGGEPFDPCLDDNSVSLSSPQAASKARQKNAEKSFSILDLEPFVAMNFQKLGKQKRTQSCTEKQYPASQNCICF